MILSDAPSGYVEKLDDSIFHLFAQAGRFPISDEDSLVTAVPSGLSLLLFCLFHELLPSFSFIPKTVLWFCRESSGVPKGILS